MSINVEKIVAILNSIAFFTWVLCGLAAFVMIMVGLSNLDDLSFLIGLGFGVAVTALIQGALMFALGHILNLLYHINNNCEGFNKISEQSNEELPMF